MDTMWGLVSTTFCMPAFTLVLHRQGKHLLGNLQN